MACARVRALSHSRTIPETDRIEFVKGTIEDRDCVDRAMRNVTHVVHLATCKEIPETVMDVTVKGLSGRWVGKSMPNRRKHVSAVSHGLWWSDFMT